MTNCPHCNGYLVNAFAKDDDRFERKQMLCCKCGTRVFLDEGDPQTPDPIADQSKDTNSQVSIDSEKDANEMQKLFEEIENAPGFPSHIMSKNLSEAILCKQWPNILSYIRQLESDNAMMREALKSSHYQFNCITDCLIERDDGDNVGTALRCSRDEAVKIDQTLFSLTIK